MPKTQSFGTLLIPPIIKASIATTLRVMFMGSQASSTEVAGQNGYLFYYQGGTDKLVFDRWTNGAASADLIYTAANYTVAGSAYSYAISRRRSDGSFTWWIKGGAYADWTLVSVAGGGGANPSAGDAVYETSNWIILLMAAGDKICMFDPNDDRISLMAWRGELDPTAGEIP